MAPKFGTSGLRGLVTELTDDLVADYTRAFLSACRVGGSPEGGRLWIGEDLRPSSPRIAATVAAAARAMGIDVILAGPLPTPALAMASMADGAAAIMVTGSHIPADRNGLKFYLPTGEIAKADEAAITAARGQTPGTFPAGKERRDDAAGAAYVRRYVTGFGAGALSGLRIGIWQHSSVARDLLADVLEGLGARAVPLDRSEVFVPVDTEAVDEGTRARLAGWCAEHKLDALVSTDGDADRPMLAAASGDIVPGDILGPLTAQLLGAEVLVTPVNSNSGVDAMGFGEVLRTRIGSPFVIAGMEERAGARVVGYEANGGFLLGYEASGPAGGPLAPLMTRDSVLPIVAPLVAARAAGQSLEDLVSALPPRFTAADRLQGIDTDKARAFLETLDAPEARAAFFDTGAAESALDRTDGLRVSFANDTVVHLRPSGNAPEFRCYAEAESPETAQRLLERHLAKLTEALGGG